MAVARYHVTPSGPKLCSASIRSCPYGGEENHFENNRDAKLKYADTPKSPAQLYRENQPAAKTLTLTGPEATQSVIYSNNWGASISDLIDLHIEETSVKPEQIEFSFYWQEPSLDDDPAQVRRYLFEAIPRLDDALGKFTNIYRLAFWKASDVTTQKAIDAILNNPSSKDLRWDQIPDSKKWEAGFGEDPIVVDMTKNSWVENSKKQRETKANNDLYHRSILNNANVVDFSELTRKLRDKDQSMIAAIQDSKEATQSNSELNASALYQQSLERKANNIVTAIKAVENSVIGPYNAYDRGIGFYRLDADRRTVVDENLSSTFVRGRHLHQLGLDSHRWLSGSWKGDALGNQGKFERVTKSGDKGIPHESPMTFWTSKTPDGARWELGLDVSSPEAGSHRVRYFDAANPNLIQETITPANPIEGFAAMKESMESRYGESAKWPKALQNDMKVLADIVEGHRAMAVSGKNSRDRYESYGFGEQTQVAKEKAEHRSLFGGLSKLFG